MATIKTRDVTKGTIKTLDRASSYTHHMKDSTIRSKTAEIGNRYDNETASSYAQNTVEHYAGDGAAYAVKASVDILMQSREKAGPVAGLADTEIPIVDNRHDSQKTVNASSDNTNQNRQAFREQGIKTIRDRQSRAKMADEEVIRNAEEDRLIRRVKRASTISNRELSRYNTGRIEGKRRKTIKREELIQKRRKEYAIRRITKQNTKTRGVWNLLPIRSSRSDRNVRRTGRVLRGIAEGSRTLLSSLSIGGAVAVVVLVIMVLFGAALVMNEDGSYMEGSGDATIVEVARGELGNVGGDKFWKWYGFRSHVDWCAIFVSWCANQCGYIENGIMPKFAVVGDGARWFKVRHRWAGRGYKPKPGDIIFFDYEQDGLLDHVGIVESCDGKTLTTIEGNSGNACKRQSYRVGSSQIAGYGLNLIPGGGNNAQRIARKASQLAYPDSPKEAKYHGGKPTPAYAAALERAYPHRRSWGKPPRDGASCDVFVGVCVVDSGVDKDFPRGYRDQAIRLDNRKDLYECIASITSGSIPESLLKDGDIIRYDKSNGGCHICIYVGGRIKQAGYDNFYPRTNSVGNKLNIKGKKLIRVYRVKG